MIIIGVDPGTVYTGFGIINQSRNSLIKVSSGIVKLPSSHSLSVKLEIIYAELDKLLKIYQPSEFAIETAFYGKNVQSAMKIGYARGVSMLAAVHHGIPVSEYSPREIKKAVVGSGAASKEQVGYMIRTLLKLNNEKMRYDETDALAVALCHAFKLKSPSKKSKDWKAFIEAFPDRVIR